MRLQRNATALKVIVVDDPDRIKEALGLVRYAHQVAGALDAIVMLSAHGIENIHRREAKVATVERATIMSTEPSPVSTQQHSCRQTC